MTHPLATTSPDRPRVALFIDGENVASSYADRISIWAYSHGDLVVRRVYGGVPKVPGWEAAPGFRMVHTGSGKNGADLVLAIEAVSLSYEGRADVFVVVSSDGDFSHLALHLRERGFKVVGMGEGKAPMAFRKACNDFCTLTVAKSAGVLPDRDDISGKVAKVIRDHDGPIPIKLLGSRMGQRGIRISERPEKKWRAYLDTRPDLFRCQGDGQEACVTLATKD